MGNEKKQKGGKPDETEKPQEGEGKAEVTKTIGALFTQDEVYGEAAVHVDQKAERVRQIVRVPPLDAFVQLRDKAYKAYLTMFGSVDTAKNVRPDIRSASLWGSKGGPEACCQAGINEGLATVGTAGQGIPRHAKLLFPDGTTSDRWTGGGGFGLTGEWMPALGTCEAVVQSFAEQGTPPEVLKEVLLQARARAVSNRWQREAGQQRAAGPKGKRPEGVTMDEQPGDYDTAI